MKKFTPPHAQTTVAHLQIDKLSGHLKEGQTVRKLLFLNVSNLGYIRFLTFLVLFLNIVFSLGCSKNRETNETNFVLEKSPFNGGEIHSEMLNYFKKKSLSNTLAIQQKIYNLSAKIKKKNTVIRKAISDYEYPSEYQDFINETFKPLTFEYIEESSIPLLVEMSGISNSEAFINDIVLNDTSLIVSPNKLISEYSLSSNFKLFINEVEDLMSGVYNFNAFSNKVSQLQYKYQQLLQDDLEKLAMINGCQTLIDSFEYWNSSSSNEWNSIFIPGNFSKSTNTSIRMADSDRGAIILADCVGAMGGVIRGGVRGMAAGPGGATIGGMIGLISGAATSSVSAYGYQRLQKFLGW